MKGTVGKQAALPPHQISQIVFAISSYSITETSNIWKLNQCVREPVYVQGHSCPFQFQQVMASYRQTFITYDQSRFHTASPAVMLSLKMNWKGTIGEKERILRPSKMKVEGPTGPHREKIGSERNQGWVAHSQTHHFDHCCLPLCNQ